MKNTIGDVVKQTIKSMPVEITDGEADLFNTFPTDEVSAALRDLIEEDSDPVIAARAFDALLKLDDFDTIRFLIDLYDESSTDWRLVACRNLSKFQDKRAVEKLCAIVLNDNDSDVRFCAAEALAAVGDETAINTLEHVKAHDSGEDYEGHRIADMADRAIQSINERRQSNEAPEDK